MVNTILFFFYIVFIVHFSHTQDIILTHRLWFLCWIWLPVPHLIYIFLFAVSLLTWTHANVRPGPLGGICRFVRGDSGRAAARQGLWVASKVFCQCLHCYCHLGAAGDGISTFPEQPLWYPVFSTEPGLDDLPSLAYVLREFCLHCLQKTMCSSLGEKG